jgi:hypothetical protein
MKKTVWILLFSISLIICVLLYLKYDRKGYEYGLGCNFCNTKMPFNLKPHDGTHYSFTIKDEDDFELVGIGFRYRKSSFKIKDFLAYGYNDTSVIVKCTDSLNKIQYLISYQTKYKSKKNNPEISFKDLNNSDYELLKGKYQWFAVNKEIYYVVERSKFLFMLGALISLLILLSVLLNLRKRLKE